MSVRGDAARALTERLSFLIRNDLRNRFVGSTLGVLWAAVIPLLQLALFAVVFGWILGARVPGLEGRLGYTTFLALGMWPWFAFSEGVMRGSTALTDNAGLITKVSIAPWQLVAARVVNAFLLHGVGFVLVVIALLLLGTALDVGHAGYALAGWLLALPLAFAVASAMALLQLFLRDLQQLLPLILTGGLFLSPILYSLDMAPEPIRMLMLANPMVGIVSATRDALLGDPDHQAMLFAVVATVVVSVMSLWLYARLRPHAEDFL